MSSRKPSSRRGIARLSAGVLLLAVAVLSIVAERDDAPRRGTPHGAVVFSHMLASAGPSADRPDRAIAGLAPSERVQASVTVGAGSPAVAIPRSFLGVSTEYWALPLYERRLSVLERVMGLLRSPGEGPLVLRIGGDSADHSVWYPRKRRSPRWMFTLTPRWVQQTSELVDNLGLRVILDLNLVTDTPSLAAQWVQVAEAGLPRGSLAGLEIGNEPDIYRRAAWPRARSQAFGGAFPPEAISAANYTRDFLSYARVLAAIAPGVPLMGPALANPVRDAGWIPRLLAGARRALQAVTVHRYPYSECAPPGAPTFPTIGRVLSEEATEGMARSLGVAIHAARSAGLPVRLSELNSVTCGGRPGVSDTFATALWAPDALFELARAGVQGVNVHVRAYPVNGAFGVSPTGLIARPLLYGMVLFTRTLGPHAELVAADVRSPPSYHLKAWVVRAQDGRLRVLLIDKGSRPVTVALHLPATGTASVQRMLAPSVRSRSGVTIAGQRIGPDGLWHGAHSLETIAPSPRGYVLTVPRYSAALVAVPVSGHGGARSFSARRSPERP